MQELNDEQTATAEAQPADAEKDNGAKTSETASYGKFKDADALYKAYNSLLSEFTKRCQRVKELESASAVDKTEVPTAKQATIPTESMSETQKQEVLKAYLKEILGAKNKAIVMDGNGSGIKSPADKPATIEAAGKLAKEFFGR